MYEDSRRSRIWGTRLVVMRAVWKDWVERRAERVVRRVRWSSNVQCGEEARAIRVLRQDGGQEDLPASIMC